MAKSKPSKTQKATQREKGREEISEKELERRHERFFLVFHTITVLGRYLAITVSVVGLAYFGIYKPIEISHGETTTISYVVDFLANMKADVMLARGVTTGSLAMAWAERRKRLRERKERDERIRKLETAIDQGRTQVSYSFKTRIAQSWSESRGASPRERVPGPVIF